MSNAVIVANNGIGFISPLPRAKLVIYKLKFYIFYPLQLTCADITFFDLMNLFSSGEPTVPEPLEKFPLLVDLYKRVLEVPGIKAWVEKRPKTDHWKSLDHRGVWSLDLAVEGESRNKIASEISDNVCAQMFLTVKGEVEEEKRPWGKGTIVTE